jgi:carbonic anhydrase
MAVDAHEALERLKEGNRRFVSGQGTVDWSMDSPHLATLVGGQSPFAVVLGCSDSRVPVELVFGQGPGELFVVRVAGHVVGPSQLESVEFAAGKLGTRLVVVLGHTHCGAVLATLQELRRSDGPTAALPTLVGHIRPAVENLLPSRPGGEVADIMEEAVPAHVHASVARLREGSELLRGLIAREGLRVVGAQYSLETGKVEFFEDDREA